jgi:excisionase family DNA binding protein
LDQFISKGELTMTDQTNEKTVFTVTEAAQYLGLAISTLNKWRCYQQEGPAYVKLGKAVRYRKEDLDAYISRVTVGDAA